MNCSLEPPSTDKQDSLFKKNLENNKWLTTPHLTGMMQTTHAGTATAIRNELHGGITPSFQFYIHAVV